MEFDELYQRAAGLAEQGRVDAAERLYGRLAEETLEDRQRALVLNDLGCLARLRGEAADAQAKFERALEVDADCEAAQSNLLLLGQADPNPRRLAVHQDMATAEAWPARPGTRVAMLSFLFNWPSKGGGIIHTVELCEFLRRAGYEVGLFYVQYAPWKIGNVRDCPFPGRAVSFGDADWNLETIQRRLRETVTDFSPDHVIITDSWNIKPYLAEAVRGYPYFLRMQAMECLCPLNNLRLLMKQGMLEQCAKNQLATPEECLACLQEQGIYSGELHRLERMFCQVWTQDYRRLLRRAFAEAEAVLTLNQATASLLAPFARDVRVVTWGMDPDRFLRPSQSLLENDRSENRQDAEKTVILFAGLAQEPIKGLEILRRAGQLLWQRRQDFEVLVTDDIDDDEKFLRGVGWQSQAGLPALYRQADIVVVPSVAQEGLSRTAVEAMASSRPVVASRIGGLTDLIEDGVTGLFAQPGQAEDLAAKIETLLDEPKRRAEMGRQGRRRFERDFA